MSKIFEVVNPNKGYEGTIAKYVTESLETINLIQKSSNDVQNNSISSTIDNLIKFEAKINAGKALYNGGVLNSFSTIKDSSDVKIIRNQPVKSDPKWNEKNPQILQITKDFVNKSSLIIPQNSYQFPYSNLPNNNSKPVPVSINKQVINTDGRSNNSIVQANPLDRVSLKNNYPQNPSRIVNQNHTIYNVYSRGKTKEIIPQNIPSIANEYCPGCNKVEKCYVLHESCKLCDRCSFISISNKSCSNCEKKIDEKFKTTAMNRLEIECDYHKTKIPFIAAQVNNCGCILCTECFKNAKSYKYCRGCRSEF